MGTSWALTSITATAGAGMPAAAFVVPGVDWQPAMRVHRSRMPTPARRDAWVNVMRSFVPLSFVARRMQTAWLAVTAAWLKAVREGGLPPAGIRAILRD